MRTSCGPSWLPERVNSALFGWFFNASCQQHDKNYERGGNEIDRWLSDFEFLAAMYYDVKDQQDVKKPIAAVLMVAYYLAVMLLGWLSFNYN